TTAGRTHGTSSSLAGHLRHPLPPLAPSPVRRPRLERWHHPPPCRRHLRGAAAARPHAGHPPTPPRCPPPPSSRPRHRRNPPALPGAGAARPGVLGARPHLGQGVTP